ncbi:MAG: DNA-directed DNA polymerase I [Thermoproteota archaeon]
MKRGRSGARRHKVKDLTEFLAVGGRSKGQLAAGGRQSQAGKGSQDLQETAHRPEEAMEKLLTELLGGARRASREDEGSGASAGAAEAQPREQQKPSERQRAGSWPRAGDASSKLRVPMLSSLQPARKPREARPGERGYLVQTYYDGERGVIVAKLYDDGRGEILLFADKTGYKPYFLVDLEPDKVQENAQIVRHSGFDHVEVVEKLDLLRWRKRRLTKIVVKTPDVVPQLRSKVPAAWEANIKFHHNYIYDHQLVPGLLYVIANGSLRRAEVSLDDKMVEEIRAAFQGEREETIKVALEWAPYFEQPPPKPLRLAVDIEVYTPFKGRVPDASAASYPVISIAFAADDGLRLVFVLGEHFTRVGATGRAKLASDVAVEIFDEERAMLLEAFKLISSYPVVLTFNGDNFDLTYLLNRALKLGIPRDQIPLRVARDRITLEYGVHIDLYKFFSIKAVQSYAFGNAYKEFTLDAIASALLGESKVEVEGNIGDLPLAELVNYNFRDAELTLKLTKFGGDLVWKLMVLLMRISKLPMEDLTRSQISSWVKSLLYWEHRRRGYLIPNKEEIASLKGRTRSSAVIKGKKYQGAIVLDPPSGVYFNVVVLDFASLYPSIIKEWNLSYETVNPEHCPGGETVKVPDVGHTVCKNVPGLTAQIVGLLRDYRVRIYKKKAKSGSVSEDARAWYDTVQAAMKVFINASYGVFGAETFPFYAPPVAESVTAIGRYTIRQTLRKASELGLRILYGDTDSLFIWNPDPEKLKKLQEYVRESFGLELEVDKSYRFVTFSGLKKNYVGVYEDGKVDVKGLVAKKRNAPEFLKKEFMGILETLSKVSNPEDFIEARESIKARVREIYRKLKDLEYTLDELAIKVALNKPVDAYTKNTPQHVKAAKQLMAHGVQVLPGDVVVFVKVKSKEGVKPIQLARLKEVDVDKYVDSVRTTLEQLLSAINLAWDSVVGGSRLEAFMKAR